MKHSAKGAPRVWQAEVQGSSLVTASGTQGKSLKSSTKSFTTSQEALNEHDKAVRAKLRDGYAYVRDARAVQPGEVVLHAFASGGGSGFIIDLSRDGRTALTVGSNSGLSEVWFELIDVATGARTTVHEISSPKRQAFVHTALFDATGGAIYYAHNEATVRFDLASKTVAVLADYTEGRSANFNSHVVHPHFDEARARLVVFDSGSLVRVLDSSHAIVFETSTDARTTECRGAAISPSGKRLAVYRVSRGVVYSHADAGHDRTCEVEVWDVDSGKLLATLPLPAQIDELGIDARDELLLVSRHYARGPVAYDLRTGEERWAFRSADGPHDDPMAHAWAYSPDGSMLAVGRGGAFLYDSATRAEIPLGGPLAHRTPVVRFSADGSLLAAAEDANCVVRRVR